MSSVDNRVVAMKFDNAQFEAGVKTTMTSMEKLKQNMSFAGSAKGLDEISNGVAGISAKFLALSTIAITALSNITNKAIDAGAQLAKSFTIDPIKSGFDEYELKMGSIQTIMSGSGASLEEVNKQLGDLNTYSDKTIYSFKDMTSNIGKFTNAGVDLKTSVGAIQGIANAAALSGANSEEASRSMYNFAQALSSGSVKLMDWKSIELANMGTIEFKNQLIEGAVAAGKLKKGVGGMYKTLEGTPISATKGFNESLADEWLTSDVLIKTLGKYADTNTDIGKRATAAAQDVKTFSQMMDTLKESAGSGWAQSSEIIFGNFTEGKGLWTGLNNVFSGMIGKSADARNKLLQDWKDLGGRDILFAGIKNAAEGLSSVLKPIKEAFRSIFPAATGQSLLAMTTAFKNFTAGLKVGAETADKLKRTFAGVFAVFDIVKQVIVGVIKMFGSLSSGIGGGAGGILSFTAKIGDLIVSFDQALKKGNVITNFFLKIADVIKNAMGYLERFGDSIRNIFGKAKEEAAGPMAGVSGAVDNVKDRLTVLQKVLGFIKDAWQGFINIMKSVGEKVSPIIDKIKDALGEFWSSLSGIFDSKNFSILLASLNVGLFGGILLMVRKFFKGGFGVDIGGGLFESVKKSFDTLTGTLKTMQQQIKVNMLIKIAVAVGILTVSIVVLSMIDPAKLTKAMIAISVGFGLLVGSLTLLTKFASSSGAAKMTALSVTLIALSLAVLILSIAAKKMSEIEQDDLIRAGVAIAGFVTIMVAAGVILSKNEGSLARAGTAMIGMSVSMIIMSIAVQRYSDMKLSEIGAGMGAIAGGLIVMAFAMRLMPDDSAMKGLGLILVANGLKKLVDVIQAFSGVDWKVLTKGIGFMGAALASIGLGLKAFPEKSVVKSSLALIVLSFSLGMMVDVIKDMGKIKGGDLAKGLVGLGVSLVLVSAAANSMRAALPGALAMVAFTGALKLFVPVLEQIGKIPIPVLATALITLAAVFVILGAAAYFLGPFLPVLIGLGITLMEIAFSVTLLGLAVMAAGAGFLFLAMGIGALAAISAGGIYALSQVIKVASEGIPVILKNLAEGIIGFMQVFVKNVDTIVAFFQVLMGSILQAAINTVPKIGELITQIITTALQVLHDNKDRMIEAGWGLLFSLLKGLYSHVTEIQEVAKQIVIKIMNKIGEDAQPIADAAVRMIINLVNAISNAITQQDAVKKIMDAGGRVAGSIFDGIVNYIWQHGAKRLSDAMVAVAKNAVLGPFAFIIGSRSPSTKFRDFGKDITDGLIIGLEETTPNTISAVKDLANGVLDTTAKIINTMSDSISGEINLDPVITPVLDLSNVQKNAYRLDGMLSTSPINAAVSYGNASAISSDQQAQSTAVVSQTDAASPTLIFTQTNNSPAALSTADIYRQTRNQLSLVKEALKL